MRPADPNPEGPAPESETPQVEQALRWLQHTHAQAELIGAVHARVKRQRQRRLAFVATVCVALAAGGFAWRQTRPATPALPIVAEATPTRGTTILRLPLRETLPDGSIVEFKDGAEISERFTADFRRITLVRGEAHFQVKKDPTRPFIVTARGVDVRAVGTAFTVNLETTAVEVVVTEGRVAVESHSTASPLPSPSFPATGISPTAATEPALVSARGRAVVPTDGAIPALSTLSEADLARRLAWRVPRLELARTLLPEIIDLLNQHATERGRKPLLLDPNDPRLQAVKVSGILGADNIDGLVRLLETNYQVQAEDRPDYLLLRFPR
jgi:transmembrane sensor